MKSKSKLATLVELFCVFAEMGAVTFGGGYAMLPMLQREVVEKRGWAQDEELMDYYAIGQCTPGIIAINVATFIGYKLAGLAGAIIATLGMVFPSIVIITVISIFLTAFAELEVVKHAFVGIRAAVTVLIFDSVLKLAKKSVIDLPCAVIALAVCALSLTRLVSPPIIIVIAGLAGWTLKSFGAKNELKGAN